MVKGCDLENGVCEIPDLDNNKNEIAKLKNTTLYYVGDPMCSWCWGLSPALKQLEQYCNEHDIAFSIVVGGLRAGGGDLWNSEFKNFLREEWAHIGKTTGQQFTFKLLDEEYFNYDTEPACRAFVVGRELIERHNISPQNKLVLFSMIQKKFYTEGLDPKEVNFYQSICAELKIPYSDFKEEFNKKENFQKTKDEFLKARSLKIRGFPSLVLLKDNESKLISTGYITKNKAIEKMEELLFGTIVVPC